MFTRRYLNTNQASVYLKSIGVSYTSKTLAVLRCYGRGPGFRRVGRRIYYTISELDHFASGHPVMTIDSREG